MEVVISLFRQIELLKDQMQAVERRPDIPSEAKGMIKVVEVGLHKVWDETLNVNRAMDDLQLQYERDIKKLKNRIAKLDA